MELNEAKKKKAKRKSNKCSSITYTTGNPGLNAAFFNRYMTYDENGIPKPSVPGNVDKDFGEQVCNNANDGAGVTTGGSETAGLSSTTTSNCEGSASSTGGMSEELMHAKRLNVTVELPADIHILAANTVDDFIEELEPEEEFNIGYITPVYFYKELWDKFTLFKCTEMRGWTGIDYIEARADAPENKQARIDLSKEQKKRAEDAWSANNPINDNGIHGDRQPGLGSVADFSAQYNKINKTVRQRPKRPNDDYGSTVLFYPVVGSKPNVVYYIDLKDGSGPMLVDRADLEATIYPKVKDLAKNRGMQTMEKVRNMLAIDNQTIAAKDFNQEDQYETRSRFDTTYTHVKKPQVRALYVNQIYYLANDKKYLGVPLFEAKSVSVDTSKTLTEKRETKRYYIRPQDVFCANKADVLKTLVDVYNAGENCTVYTLKNLSDHDDVHKLTNDDIIYTYDKGVLLDKNRVLVADYDLFIKHEEERKQLNKDPDALTIQDYNQEYDDRMTQNTFVEGMWGGDDFTAYGYLIHNVSEYGKKAKYLVVREVDDELWYYGAYNKENQAKDCADELNVYSGSRAKVIPNTNLDSWDNISRTFKEACNETYSIKAAEIIPLSAFNLAIERGETVDVGWRYEEKYSDKVIDNSRYSNTAYEAYKDNGKYIIVAHLFSEEGDDVLGDEYSFATIDELVNYIYQLELDACPIEFDNEMDNPFDTTFESYDVFGNRLTEDKNSKKLSTCCICGEEYAGYGNNAEPYKKGYCCDACNLKFVIPARIGIMNDFETEENENKTSKE